MFIVGSAALILLGITTSNLFYIARLRLPVLPTIGSQSYSTLLVAQFIRRHFVQLAWAGHRELAVLARLSDQF